MLYVSASRTDIVPGDMIIWIDTTKNKLVRKDEQLFSTISNCYVPIGMPALLISMSSYTYMWLNTSGLFIASIHDTVALHTRLPSDNVVPRKLRGLNGTRRND